MENYFLIDLQFVYNHDTHVYASLRLAIFLFATQLTLRTLYPVDLTNIIIPESTTIFNWMAKALEIETEKPLIINKISIKIQILFSKEITIHIPHNNNVNTFKLKYFYK